MFVNKTIFEEKNNNDNNYNNASITPRSTNSLNSNNSISAKQKLAERRKLIAAQNKPKQRGKRVKSKIIKKNIDFHGPNNNLSEFGNINNMNSSNTDKNNSNDVNRSNDELANDDHHGMNQMNGMDMNLSSNNSMLSSPSSRQSKDDSIQNIKVIDNYNQKSPQNNNALMNAHNDSTNIHHISEDIDLNEFVTTPVPKNKIMQTYIIRDKSGITNRLYPSYCVYLKDTKTFLMFAKKKQKTKTSNYIITSDAKNTDKSQKSYLGKVRANFVGTEFTVYDNGRSPKDVTIFSLPLRTEIGSILYETNILGSKGPRKMTVLLPKSQENRDKWKQTDIKASMLMSSYKQNEMDSIINLQNKSPKWNENIGAYVLNFSGRVTMASVKNFQLVIPGNDDDVILQFGRVGKDRFTMDFKHPLTPLQAFGICLTSFDNKLACE